MKWGNKPVIVLGHGVRACGVDPAPLLEIGIPILTSWQGMDLVDNWHPNYFGRPGIYGQRCANRILYEADQIISVGSRMCVWMIGHAGLRPNQELVMVDVDGLEAAKFPKADWMAMDAGDFIRRYSSERIELYEWMFACNVWKRCYPWIEEVHADSVGFINSYKFIQQLEPFLKKDSVIVTDNGSVMCPVFQSLHVKPPQRVLTAGGLGEMGCGLPGAIGASFARNKGEVLAFIGDGGMMMNLQELATIAHHKLPIKILVFENDGYSMIKGTYDNLKKDRKGVSKETGLTLPNFYSVAEAFDIRADEIHTWDDFKEIIPFFMSWKGPMLVNVHIDPEQQFVPRLKPIIKDGKITPAQFDQLSPII